MVFKRECANCGKLLDFGGDEDDYELPENAIEFDDKVYCKECVQEFVEFGTGDIMNEVEKLKRQVKQIRKDLDYAKD